MTTITAYETILLRALEYYADKNNYDSNYRIMHRDWNNTPRHMEAPCDGGGIAREAIGIFHGVKE